MRFITDYITGIAQEEAKAVKKVTQLLDARQSFEIDGVPFVPYIHEKDAENPVKTYDTVDRSNAISKARQPYRKDRAELTDIMQQLQAMMNMFQQSAVLRLDSLATISVSVHEPKGMVRRLGYKGICGVTRSTRTIAGTMIFVAGTGKYGGHPLEGLMLFDPIHAQPRMMGWSMDMERGTALERDDGSTQFTVSSNNILDQKRYAKLGTLLSPFNLYMHYQTEDKHNPEDSLSLGGDDAKKINPGTKVPWENNGAAFLLAGVEFISEATVSSVNDMITEISFQFIAQDMIPLTSNQGLLNEGIGNTATQFNNMMQKFTSARGAAESRGQEIVKVAELSGAERHIVEKNNKAAFLASMNTDNFMTGAVVVPLTPDAATDGISEGPDCHIALTGGYGGYSYMFGNFGVFSNQTGGLGAGFKLNAPEGIEYRSYNIVDRSGSTQITVGS